MKSSTALLAILIVSGCGGSSGGGGNSHQHSQEIIWELAPVREAPSRELGQIVQDQYIVRRNGIAPPVGLWNATVSYTDGGAKRQAVFYNYSKEMNLFDGRFETALIIPNAGKWFRNVEVVFVEPPSPEEHTLIYTSEFDVADGPPDVFPENIPQVKLLDPLLLRAYGGKIGLHLGEGVALSDCLGRDVDLANVFLRVRIAYPDRQGVVIPDQIVEISQLDPEGLVKFTPTQDGSAVARGEFRPVGCEEWEAFTPQRTLDIRDSGLPNPEPVVLLGEYRMGSEMDLGCATALLPCGAPAWHLLISPDGYQIAVNFPFVRSAEESKPFIPHTDGLWGVDVILSDSVPPLELVLDWEVGREVLVTP